MSEDYFMRIVGKKTADKNYQVTKADLAKIQHDLEMEVYYLKHRLGIVLSRVKLLDKLIKQKDVSMWSDGK